MSEKHPWIRVPIRDNGEGFDVRVTRDRLFGMLRFHVEQIVGDRILCESWAIDPQTIDHARVIPCREFRVGVEGEGRLTIYIDGPGPDQVRPMLDHPSLHDDHHAVIALARRVEAAARQARVYGRFRMYRPGFWSVQLPVTDREEIPSGAG